MISMEHTKTHSSDEIHSTHRQDIGKVSLQNSVILCIHVQVSITYKVFILTEAVGAHIQYKSMAIKYLNRFAIEEDDQFEIHVKDYKDKGWLYEVDFYKAAEEVILKAQQGQGYYCL